MVGEAHAARCPGEVVGSLQVLVGEALWQFPVLGPAEQGLHHAGEEWALVLSGHGWRAAAINSCGGGGGGGELVTMSSDNMAGGAAPSPATLRPELPSSSGRCSSVYGFKISGGDTSKVRNLLPMFVSSRSTAREAPSGVTFRVKGDASWQTQQPNRNSDKCDIRMYRGEDMDDTRFIKLCGVNLGSCPASPDPYPLFRCNTLPRRLPSYRLSPLPPWPQGSAASPDSEIMTSDSTSRRLSLEPDEGVAAGPAPPGGDAGGGRGCGRTLPRPPPPLESSSSKTSQLWGSSPPAPPWGATGSAPPDTTRSCNVNSIPRPYRGSGSTSSSTSSSPVPPALPQLHRPRDFLPTIGGDKELPLGEPVSPLQEDELDTCFPYEMQPPAPLLTTCRRAAQRAAAGHVGSGGRVTSVRSTVVGAKITTDTESPDTDTTVVTDVNFTSVSESADQESATEGMTVATSQALTHVSWPVRGHSEQGRPRKVAAPTEVSLPNTRLYHAQLGEAVKGAEVGVEAVVTVTQDSGTFPCRTPATTQGHQHGPREQPIPGGTLRPTRPSLPEEEEEEEATPPTSKEATPQPSSSPVMEVTPPTTKETTLHPAPPSPISEEEVTPPTSKEATPQPSPPSTVLEEEVTPSTSKEATPQPSPPSTVLEEEVTPPTSKEATPQPSPSSPIPEEEVTLPTSKYKKATPQPSPPSPVLEEVTLPTFKEATPQPSSPSPVLEEEVTLPTFKQATSRPSSTVLEEDVTPPTSKEATSRPSSPVLEEEVTLPASKEDTSQSFPPSLFPEEVTPPVSKEATPPPSSPFPCSLSGEATSCLSPATQHISLPASPPEEVTAFPQSKQTTPPPSPPSPSEQVTPPLPSPPTHSSEEATPSSSATPSHPWKKATLVSPLRLQEITPFPSQCREATFPASTPALHYKEVTTPPSPPAISSVQATPPSPPVIPREDTPPSLSCIASKVTTSSSSRPSITSKDVTPPFITTREATPPSASTGGVGDPASARRKSAAAAGGDGVVGEAAAGGDVVVGETAASGPVGRGAEGALRPGISQRAALLTRHHHGDAPARPRPTRFPLDIICGSKVSGEVSPVAGTRHRLSSLGQVLPPPTHTSARSKSASRVGSSGTNPQQGTLRRDSDLGPQGGTGRGLGQAEGAAAPRPVVLPLDATLKNKIRQTIDSFTGMEVTPTPVPALTPAPDNVLSSSHRAGSQQEMAVQYNKKSEIIQRGPHCSVPNDEVPAGEASHPAEGGPLGVHGSGDSAATLDSLNQCSSRKRILEDAEGAVQAVTRVTPASSGDLHAMVTQMDDANNKHDSRQENTSLAVCEDTLKDVKVSRTQPMVVDALAATCSGLLERPLAVTSNESLRSRSPSRLQELEAQLLFIDEGVPATQQVPHPHHSPAAVPGYHGTESLTSPPQGRRQGLVTEAATSKIITNLLTDEGVQQNVASSEGTFAAVRVVVTEAPESSSECESGGGSLVREESVEEYEPALEVVAQDLGHDSNHSSVSEVTLVTLDSPRHTPELHHPDEDAEEEFVDATDGTEGNNEAVADVKSINGIATSPVEAQTDTSPVGASLRVECEVPEDGSASSGGHATDPDLPASASASASSTGSETWWTSAGGPVARRDLLPLDEDEDEAQWRATLGATRQDSDEEPIGYESDEDFAAMDADMQRLEEKLKKFEIELGGHDGSGANEDSEDKGDSATSPARSSQDTESQRRIAIPEIFPSRRTTHTKHLSLMTRLEVHQYGDSASESENESQASSSSDSVDFLFVKTKVKVKPGQRISRSLDHRRPKNLHALGMSSEGGTKGKKEGVCHFEERVDLSSLVLAVEATGEESAGEHHIEGVSSDKFDDEVNGTHTGQEVMIRDEIMTKENMMTCKEVYESIPKAAEDVLWGDEDHLLLGYIWHDDDMAAVDFEGLEEFQSFEGQEALLFMFEDDDDDDEVVSEEESEGEVLPESRDEDELSPGEYLADESEGEGDSRRSRTLPSTKGSDNTFVAAFKHGLKKASKYFGPKSDVRPKKVSGGGRERLQDAPSPPPRGPVGLEDDTRAGVYNVQSGRLEGPASPLTDSEGPDIYSCSSGEYYATPAMCVNTSDEDPSLAFNRGFPQGAPSQPPVPPRRWANRKSRTPQEAEVSPQGRGGAVHQHQSLAPAPQAPLLAGPAVQTRVPRTDDHTNGSKEAPYSLTMAPQQMRGPLGSPIWEGFCPPAAPFPGPPLLPQPCVPAVPWGVDPYPRVPEAPHPHHTVPNHRLAHAAPSHPCAAPGAVLPHPCATHHAALPRPCAGHLASTLPTPAATHARKPTSVKQLKRKQQEKILRQEAEEGLEAAGCTFCVGVPQARPQPPEHTVHWRQSSPHPRASSDRRSWPPRK